ncbi:Nervana 2 [Fasciolopsis buskii]|uniref:Nervana 2 n=1 Tax=Fasciolopsis buskii TaxID=27845 RepID=A0A8E0RS52_9TREM|nr:Nervana 2 [Fasciolopsis buski]
MSMQEFSDNLSTLSYVSRRRIPSWIWDPKNKTLFGRTATSWALCILFYLAYYAFLAGFFMGMMMVFLYTQVPDDRPARTGMQSLLHFKPGIGFRPVVEVQKSLIKFAKTDPQSYLPLTENIDALLDAYKIVNSKPDGQFASCKGGKKDPDDVERVCKFPLESLSPCTRENNYGYPAGTPCVILKLNKVYGWLPDIENSKVPHALVNCTGQNPADVENMGTVSYYPSTKLGGKSYGIFDSIYFPFIGQPGYLSPLVALQFTNPKPHVTILVECQLRNLKNAYTGTLGFEIRVD